MSGNPKKRKAFIRMLNMNGDDIVVQVYKRPWPMWFIPISGRWLRSHGYGFFDHHLANNALNKKLRKLQKACRDIEGLVEDIHKEREKLRAEKRDITSSTLTTYGVGRVFKTTIEDVVEFIDAPEEDYLHVLSNSIISALRKSANKASSSTRHVDRGASRTGYMDPKDFDKLSRNLSPDGNDISVTFDDMDVMKFREPNQKKKGKKGKSNNNQQDDH